jgi:hypothetical protein
LDTVITETCHDFANNQRLLRRAVIFYPVLSPIALSLRSADRVVVLGDLGLLVRHVVKHRGIGCGPLCLPSFDVMSCGASVSHCKELRFSSLERSYRDC